MKVTTFSEGNFLGLHPLLHRFLPTHVLCEWAMLIFGSWCLRGFCTIVGQFFIFMENL
jgi:hypothetical protein